VFNRERESKKRAPRVLSVPPANVQSVRRNISGLFAELGLNMPVSPGKCHQLLVEHAERVYEHRLKVKPDPPDKAAYAVQRLGKASEWQRFFGKSRSASDTFADTICTLAKIRYVPAEFFDAAQTLVKPKAIDNGYPSPQLGSHYVEPILAVDFPERRTFTSLASVLTETGSAVTVLLGPPGSGKTTLLGEFAHESERRRVAGEHRQIAFYVSLASYRLTPVGTLPTPEQWLNDAWSARNGGEPTLLDIIRDHRALLLIDGVNEIPPLTQLDYMDGMRMWREFITRHMREGNRTVFACRTRDYDALLFRSNEIKVTQARILPMEQTQISTFVERHVGDQSYRSALQEKLHTSELRSIFRSPLHLKMLIDTPALLKTFPTLRAQLFAGFVRFLLQRERATNRLLLSDSILTEADWRRINNEELLADLPVALPDEGYLIPMLSQLAFAMHSSAKGSKGTEVRIRREDALLCVQKEFGIERPVALDLLDVAISISILKEDEKLHELMFDHPLLQAFFAGHYLASHPDARLVHVEWQSTRCKPDLNALLDRLGPRDRLSLLSASGWEEVSRFSSALAPHPDKLIRGLATHNLPLAALCMSEPGVVVSDRLVSEIREKLMLRIEDVRTDLRAKLVAGWALGRIGDLRSVDLLDVRCPRMSSPIAAGTYSIGSQMPRERPLHTVLIEPFRISVFPVTNSQFALFIEAGGYLDDQWWEGPAAKAWLAGRPFEYAVRPSTVVPFTGQLPGATVRLGGTRQDWLQLREKLFALSIEEIQDIVTKGEISSERAKDWLEIRDWSQSNFDQWIEGEYPSVEIHREPAFLFDDLFNNPAQPVVGLSWFEARAYCKWLSESTERKFRLPLEIEYEAAARGKDGRQYPYEGDFDRLRSNVSETHLRGTSPVGIFANATPEGVFDLCGNVWEWTSTIYRNHPYSAMDDRESLYSDEPRVLKGGAWTVRSLGSRGAARYEAKPSCRKWNIGFRVVETVEP